ncbi:MAG: hypothetical protein ACFNX0_08060, partial [Treponema sp.]
KAADFTTLAAGAQWEKYYVIIRQEGTKYIAVRYLAGNTGDPETGNTPSNTYQTPAKPASLERYLKPEDITAIVTNKVAVKASMDKIKTIPGLSEYKNDNCIASEDNGYSFTNGNGTSLTSWTSGSFIPFAAREFN